MLFFKIFIHFLKLIILFNIHIQSNNATLCVQIVERKNVRKTNSKHRSGVIVIGKFSMGK